MQIVSEIAEIVASAIDCVLVLWFLTSHFGKKKTIEWWKYAVWFCNLLEYLTQRDIQTKNSGVNVRYRGKHRFFKGFNEFIKEKTRRCDNDFEKIERHVFF